MLCRRMAKISDSKRQDAYGKSGGKCWFCGERPAAHVEHLTPKERGGTHELENLVGACQRCNYAKAGHRVPGNPNWDLEEFRLEVSRRLKVSPEDVVFYGERLHAQRQAAWEAAGRPSDRWPYKLGRLDDHLGIKAEPFSFPDEPSLESRLMDDDDIQF